MIKYFYNNKEVKEEVFYEELIQTTDNIMGDELYKDNLIENLQDDIMSLVIFKNTKHTIGEGRSNFRVESNLNSLNLTIVLCSTVIFYMEED